MSNLTPAAREQLLGAYLCVFDGFSANRTDVANSVGVSKDRASALLNRLRKAALIVDVDVNDASQGAARRGAFAEVEWQCWDTYDSIDRAEAIEKFDSCFPIPNTNTNKSEEDKMATITRKSTKAPATKQAKATAKPAAKKETTKAATASSRRTAEDIDKLVPEFTKHLKAGGTMRQLKADHGFSGDEPIRAALYRAGLDSKGNPHGVEAGDLAGLTPAKLKARLVAEREAGAPWYALVYRTGSSLSDVKALVAEAGGAATGRVYLPAAEKPAKKPAAKKAAKPAAKKAAAAADPS